MKNDPEMQKILTVNCIKFVSIYIIIPSICFGVIVNNFNTFDSKADFFDQGYIFKSEFIVSGSLILMLILFINTVFAVVKSRGVILSFDGQYIYYLGKSICCRDDILRYGKSPIIHYSHSRIIFMGKTLKIPSFIVNEVQLTDKIFKDAIGLK